MALGKNAAVAPVLATIALLLAAIGLYAVIAQSVSRRTREIGVRIAIGAAAADVRRMELRDWMSPVAAGLMIGIAAGLGVNRVLQSQLVGVTPYDPLTMIAAPVLLALVAWGACAIPARRAVSIDPAVALRHD
jgi:ABC-type antimicrobial peptide transport system permease subunit